MLTKEMKLQAFLKMRTKNYRASLRLEGLNPSQAENTDKPKVTAVEPKTKQIQ